MGKMPTGSLINKPLREGEALFSEGKIEEAERCFLDLLDNNPANPEILNNVGVIQYTRGNL
jgi:Flp pilus assembly protein TadD